MATRWFILLSVILAGADQYTKYLARKLVDPETLQRLFTGEIGAERNEVIPGFFSLTLNFNKGIAWGMLPEWSEYFTYFAIVMVLVILMILKKLDRDEVWLKIALAFQMAGAIGNMTDRLIFHRVTDFLDVTLFPNTNVHYEWTFLGKTYAFHLPYDWPIFNLADSFVVIGTIVLVLVLLFTREAPREDKKPAALAAGGAGGLSAYEGLTAEGQTDSQDWDDFRKLPGSVPTEEALIEIPVDPEEEMLRPFEEYAQREELDEPLGYPGDNDDDHPDSDERSIREI